MTWSKEDELKAKEEYLLMIDALRNTEEFNGEWKGEWDSFEKEAFNGRKVKVKGDKDKYMAYWIENQKIINDANLNKFDIEEDNEYF